MELYKKEVYDALGVLTRSGLIWLLYYITKSMVKESLKTNIRLYLQTILIVLCISIYQGSNTGTYLEDSDDDPMYGHSERVVEYVATNEQKIANGLHTFVLFLIPCLLGVYVGTKE